MFTSIRFSFILRDGNRILTMKIKTWPTKEKAKEYLLRFSTVPWFAGGVVEENGEVLYELTPTGSEYVYEPMRDMIRKLAERHETGAYEQAVFYPTIAETFANIPMFTP